MLFVRIGRGEKRVHVPIPVFCKGILECKSIVIWRMVPPKKEIQDFDGTEHPFMFEIHHTILVLSLSSPCSWVANCTQKDIKITLPSLLCRRWATPISCLIIPFFWPLISQFLSIPVSHPSLSSSIHLLHLPTHLPSPHHLIQLATINLRQWRCEEERD